MKSLHFISFTSGVFDISYAVAVAARTWIGFGFLFNWIMEFADVCHRLISSPWNGIDVYCCCSCQLPGPMHRPNHIHTSLSTSPPLVCIGCDFKTANWICRTLANCNNRKQIDSIWLKYYPKFATNYNFKNHTHTHKFTLIYACWLILKWGVCVSIFTIKWLNYFTAPLIEHFHWWWLLPTCFNSRLSLA